MPDGKRRIEYCDSELPGLYVEVRSTSRGLGTYYYRFKNAANVTAHQKLGRTSEIDLSEARKRATILRGQIALGVNPRADARAQKAVLTFSEFFETRYLPYVKPRKRSWKRDQELAVRVNSVFGNTRLNQITRQQIQSFHTDLLQSGLAPATCDHHIKLIKHALNLAIDWNHLAEKNPAARVPLYNADNRRERYLTSDELKRLMAVLQTDKNRAICLLAIFLLSTGARLSEALQATWGQIDQPNRVWRIPASNSKSKRIRSVPLNAAAMDVLKQLDSTKSDWVFCNPATQARYVSVHKVWSRLRKKAGIPDIRLHDLRRSFASMLASAGRGILDIQALLGHHSPVITQQRYAFLANKTLHDAADSASVIIKGAMETATEAAGE